MKLSATQLEVLRRMDETGAPMVRWAGGFWTTLGMATKGVPSELDKTRVRRTQFNHALVPAWSVTVQTIRAMERLGLLERAHKFPEEWKDQRKLTYGRARAKGV